MGRCCSSAVVPCKFPLWILSQSICTSESWHKIFLSVSNYHTVLLPSWWIDCIPMRWCRTNCMKGERRKVLGIPDRVRQVDTLEHRSPSLPSLACDLSCSLSLALRCERRDFSHAGLIKYSHCHTATHVSPSLAGLIQQTLAASLLLFSLSFSMESWHYQRGLKASASPVTR